MTWPVARRKAPAWGANSLAHMAWHTWLSHGLCRLTPASRARGAARNRAGHGPAPLYWNAIVPAFVIVPSTVTVTLTAPVPARLAGNSTLI